MPEKDKFNPDCVSVDKSGYGNSLVFTYANKAQGLYEVGEASTQNCKNAYPYAMAYKRLFDRVVLKICKLAFDGIYSDSEADEFKERYEDEPGQPPAPQQEKPTPAAARLAARAECQRAVKAYCQKNNADENDAWKLIADTIGKPSKDFTAEDWKQGQQIAESWK